MVVLYESFAYAASSICMESAKSIITMIDYIFLLLVTQVCSGCNNVNSNYCYIYCKKKLYKILSFLLL